jgi:hypothetical protein
MNVKEYPAIHLGGNLIGMSKIRGKINEEAITYSHIPIVIIIISSFLG